MDFGQQLLQLAALQLKTYLAPGTLVPPSWQLITSDVRGISFLGRHWFSRHWAMTWEVGHLEQGDYYSRQWLQLGLRHAF